MMEDSATNHLRWHNVSFLIQGGEVQLPKNPKPMDMEVHNTCDLSIVLNKAHQLCRAEISQQQEDITSFICMSGQRSTRKSTQIAQGSVYLPGNNMLQIISPTAAVLGKFNVVYKNTSI